MTNWKQIDLKDHIAFDTDKSAFMADIVQSDRLISKMICYEKGQETPLHCHPDQDELFHVLKGQGSMIIEDKKIVLKPLMALAVPAGTIHGVFADQSSRLVITFVKSPGSGKKLIV
jgi:quercetin dioxygenase-like cupin family protein